MRAGAGLPRGLRLQVGPGDASATLKIRHETVTPSTPQLHTVLKTVTSPGLPSQHTEACKVAGCQEGGLGACVLRVLHVQLQAVHILRQNCSKLLVGLHGLVEFCALTYAGISTCLQVRSTDRPCWTSPRQSQAQSRAGDAPSALSHDARDLLPTSTKASLRRTEARQGDAEGEQAVQPVAEQAAAARQHRRADVLVLEAQDGLQGHLANAGFCHQLT